MAFSNGMGQKIGKGIGLLRRHEVGTCLEAGHMGHELREILVVRIEWREFLNEERKWENLANWSLIWVGILDSLMGHNLH